MNQTVPPRARSRRGRVAPTARGSEPDMALAHRRRFVSPICAGRRQRAQPAWTETIVSDFDLCAEPSGPFEEVLPGLSVREVREPDIFHIFFG